MCTPLDLGLCMSYAHLFIAGQGCIRNVRIVVFWSSYGSNGVSNNLESVWTYFTTSNLIQTNMCLEQCQKMCMRNHFAMSKLFLNSVRKCE